MKKQFTIKPVQVLKAVTNSVAKVESANVLNFLSAPACCREVMIFHGQTKPVFSL